MVGKPSSNLEATTHLVIVAADRYIRSPLYSSLLVLGWGAFYDKPDWLGVVLVFIATASLILTAKVDERKNLSKFSDEYAA